MEETQTEIAVKRGSVNEIQNIQIELTDTVGFVEQKIGISDQEL